MHQFKRFESVKKAFVWYQNSIVNALHSISEKFTLAKLTKIDKNKNGQKMQFILSNQIAQINIHFSTNQIALNIFKKW